MGSASVARDSDFRGECSDTERDEEGNHEPRQYPKNLPEKPAYQPHSFLPSPTYYAPGSVVGYAGVEHCLWQSQSGQSSRQT